MRVRIYSLFSLSFLGKWREEGERRWRRGETGGETREARAGQSLKRREGEGEEENEEGGGGMETQVPEVDGSRHFS